jgi:homogentisate 1,2-dioxygenase
MIAAAAAAAGANGLANPRDFLYPVATFEERERTFTVLLLLMPLLLPPQVPTG